MSAKQNCLFLIDNTPPQASWEDYFAKFNYSFLYTEHLADYSQIRPYEDRLAALLVNVPCLSNFNLLSQFHEKLLLPLIVLADTFDEQTCVRALEAGADDFLLKSINPRELHARINAIKRRVYQKEDEKTEEKEIICFGDWMLYPTSRQVFNTSGKELPLSAGEYDLLLAFVQNPHRILGREYLMQFTKHSDTDSLDRRIDVQISRLRQKIETDSHKPSLIKTIRNSGYLFTATVSSNKDEFP